jgi:hypothetical protein
VPIYVEAAALPANEALKVEIKAPVRESFISDSGGEAAVNI